VSAPKESAPKEEAPSQQSDDIIVEDMNSVRELVELIREPRVRPETSQEEVKPERKMSALKVTGSRIGEEVRDLFVLATKGKEKRSYKMKITDPFVHTNRPDENKF
jgi:hypothetical protein